MHNLKTNEQTNRQEKIAIQDAMVQNIRKEKGNNGIDE